MKLFRSLLKLDESTQEPPPADASTRSPEEDEAARDLELAREFDSRLSDLARQQLQFAAYAPEPPPQTDRRGTWVASESLDAADGAGRRVRIDGGEALEFVAEDASAGVVRLRTSRGQEVTIDGDAGLGWPDGLERPQAGSAD